MSDLCTCRDKSTDVTNPLYSRGRYNEIVFSDDTYSDNPKEHYMAVNTRYGELQRTSHIYETIPEKQETEPKKNNPNVTDYCYVDNTTMKARGVSFDKKSDTIKSDNVPVSYSLEDHCSSDEVTNPHYISHSKPVSSSSKPTDHCSSNEVTNPHYISHSMPPSSSSKPTDVPVEAHVPQTKQYAPLDTASRNPVSEYQKSAVKPPDPSIHVTPNHITELL